jgi:hypothetical protein
MEFSNGITSRILGPPLQRTIQARMKHVRTAQNLTTHEQCWLRKSDEDLKDKVKTLLPSLKKIYKAQEEILQQGGLKPHQGK